ncbi:MAG: CAP domain-containing protein [Flammeovirgaceae bacterium]|nr:CAP domain-containing protein [Flammeovirgaceae bacterium]MDW8286640.1 CAP domain-containing protein [Flammeovirgaceae bacterium]
MKPNFKTKRWLCAAVFLLLAACEQFPEIVSPKESVNKEKLLEFVNKWRTKGYKCGSYTMPAVSPVVWNEQLASAGYKHSREMVENNYFSHTGKNGSSPSDRIEAEGYHWKTYGENIAYGYSSEEVVIEG